ncbi:CCA tRNA nucleotidyltransferase [Palaeococcus ferrophilus]|uniref:CCA tRNA nucleotidyltransferase n=1 Tax=Palaeococcus ferrophilus TaxID=83868 RepID=UPI00064EDB4F|nr:CCA tRNA nucleotidyltransferase [Palaeococcus ferrophilus]
MDMERVIEEILQKIVPTEEERAFVNELMEELEEIAWEAIEGLGLDVRPYFVGSLAKDTYLAGDHDVDLFLAFPLDTPIEELRERGLELGKAIAENLDSHEVAYAEHPYVRGLYRDVEVDLVPCYDVRDWRDVRTAVDRSILHTRWVLENINGKNDEVRLLKRFLKGIKAYGSEVYVRGFSGYLAEILVIKYGSFREVLSSAEVMLRGKIIDSTGWLRRERELAMATVEREKEKPLVVLDPVDPRRNVAANLSWERFGRFYFKAREFLERPSVEHFFPPEPFSGDYLRLLREKGTHLLTLLFEAPEGVDDVVLPQVEKSARGIARGLDVEGFTVRGHTWGRGFIMFEVERIERPGVRLQRGPEFYSEQGKMFYEKYDRVWLVERTLYAEREQEEDIVETLVRLLERGSVPLGKHLRGPIREADILVDFVPKKLEKEAYLFLSRGKTSLK